MRLLFILTLKVSVPPLFWGKLYLILCSEAAAGDDQSGERGQPRRRELVHDVPRELLGLQGIKFSR